MGVPGRTAGSKVLVVEPDARGRLRVLAALQGRHEPVIVDDGEDLLRAIRRVRPRLVLLAMARGRQGQAFRSCRSIKTDGREPPKVGLMDPWLRVGDPISTLGSCLGDGYLGGIPDGPQVLAFVDALLADSAPVVMKVAPAPGLWTRLLRKG